MRSGQVVDAHPFPFNLSNLLHQSTNSFSNDLWIDIDGGISAIAMAVPVRMNVVHVIMRSKQ